jgi:hypothetical protein
MRSRAMAGSRYSNTHARTTRRGTDKLSHKVKSVVPRSLPTQQMSGRTRQRHRSADDDEPDNKSLMDNVGFCLVPPDSTLRYQLISQGHYPGVNYQVSVLFVTRTVTRSTRKGLVR